MDWKVESPNGELVITIELAHGQLTYSVGRAGSPVVAPSRLGLETSLGSLAENLTHVATADVVAISERYELPHGKQRSLRSEGNELTVTFATEQSGEFSLVLRAHDDGVAFRYRVDNPAGLSTKVTDELTEFSFAADGHKWSLPQQLPEMHAPAYENAYVDGVPIGHGAPIPGWLFPSLFESGEHWVLLSESDVDGTFSAGYLRPNPEGRTYRMSFPQPGEALGLGDHQPMNNGSWQTPWRVIITSPQLGNIFESNLVRHLASPTRIEDTSWIEPGRVAWSWWSDHASPQDPDALKGFVDFAAEFGWEHTLIDANWNLIPQDEFQAVLDHATAQGVGVFLWYNSGGPNNRVTEQPRDRMFDTDTRRAEMAKLRDWGVKGVKVDFFHSDKQAGMQLYLDIIRDAAEAGLMVNFHGSTIPRGWDRTWPNMMTMEGVRGAEQYDFVSTYPDEAPWHNVILALTRNVVGPMDYTPVTFSDVQFPHKTTNAHELALSIVFESPLQHFADSAQSYRAQPQPVRDFLAAVPAVWDETRFVDGYPGDFIVVARRNGTDWYVAGINGREESRTIVIDPAQFGFKGTSTLFSDASPREFDIREAAMTDKLEVAMMPRGGFVLTVRD